MVAINPGIIDLSGAATLSALPPTRPAFDEPFYEPVQRPSPMTFEAAKENTRITLNRGINATRMAIAHGARDGTVDTAAVIEGSINDGIRANQDAFSWVQAARRLAPETADPAASMGSLLDVITPRVQTYFAELPEAISALSRRAQREGYSWALLVTRTGDLQAPWKSLIPDLPDPPGDPIPFKTMLWVLVAAGAAALIIPVFRR